MAVTNYKTSDHALPMRANSETVAKKVAEMCPVTDAMRERSAANDRSRLREDLTKLKHEENFHREALAQSTALLDDYAGKLAQHQKALEALAKSQIRASLKRSKEFELKAKIDQLEENKVKFWTKERDKHAKLLAQVEKALAAFDHEGLKAYEAEQKLLGL